MAGARRRRSFPETRDGTASSARLLASVLLLRLAAECSASSASSSAHKDVALPAPLCAGTQREARPCSARHGRPHEHCPGPGGQLRERCFPIDCRFAEWTVWSGGACTGLCERQRSTTMNNDCGAPCNGSLIETKRGCYQNNCHDPGIQDCVWQHWSDWSGCSCTCGGGQRSRDRFVLTPPKGSGRMCEARDKSEIAPCNLGPCACVDAAWAAWDDWTPCTSTCASGTQVRSRRVKEAGNDCGKPLEGMGTEQRQCNADKACEADRDCNFAPWNDWGDCTCPCSGVRKRERSIDTFGRGRGLFCEGPTAELAACDGSPNCTWYHEDAAVDCALGFWQSSGECSVTCGRAQMTRSRPVIAEAKNGGRPCEGSTSETHPCDLDPCPDAPIDCKVGPWSDWGDCNKCGGQKQRFRDIARAAENGGEACGLSLEEEGACPERSCDMGKVWCAWSTWHDWSDCSATCGTGGVQWRGRQLEVSDDTSTSGFSVRQIVQGYDALAAHAARVRAARLRELAAAFLVGLAAPLLFVAFGARADGWRRATYQPVLQPASERPIGLFPKRTDSRDIVRSEPTQDVGI